MKWVHPNWSWATTPGSEVDDIALLEALENIDADELPLAPRKAKQGDEVFALGWLSTGLTVLARCPTLVRELQTKVANPRN